MYYFVLGLEPDGVLQIINGFVLLEQHFNFFTISKGKNGQLYGLFVYLIFTQKPNLCL